MERLSHQKAAFFYTYTSTPGYVAYVIKLPLLNLRGHIRMSEVCRNSSVVLYISLKDPKFLWNRVYFGVHELTSFGFCFFF